VSKIHVVGRGITQDEDKALYHLFDTSDLTTAKGRKGVVEALMFFNSWWPETYQNLKTLCTRERPDFIFGDILADACVDIMEELHLPIATMYPQMPIFMAPQKYIPGLPGLQHKHITSEHATVWERLYEEYFRFQFVFAAKDMILHKRKMRAELGVRGGGRPPQKPNYLLFVNSFFGVEVAKDLPPLMRPIGPVLAESFPPLDASGDLAQFLSTRRKVLYVAFGSHVNLPDWRVKRLIHGFVASMDAGHLDGVIWAMKNFKATQEAFSSTSSNSTKSYTDSNDSVDYHKILSNEDPRFIIAGWIPQRAILDHPSVCLYVSHCGASSTMEAVYHGVPVLAMPIYMDQLGNSKRLVAAGVAIQMDRHKFTVTELAENIKAIVEDVQGNFQGDVLRLQRIATVNSRRKYLAADMIEEVMFDHELRFEHDDGSRAEGKLSLELGGFGRELRPMHLQTADCRMSWVKANNLDLWFLCASSIAVPVLFVRWALGG
jgi:hypothetical protein